MWTISIFILLYVEIACFRYIGLNKIFNVTTRKFKITCVDYTIFLFFNAALYSDSKITYGFLILSTIFPKQSK